MNKWRTIRYTDDGCSLYQCLSCKSQWEGRSAPGWFSTTEECEPGTVYDTNEYLTYQQAGVTHYYVRTEPRYVVCWRYCPYCGVEWEGPVRCDVDNERMLGEKRLKADRAMTYEHHCPPPDYWYVVQTKAGIAPSDWYNKTKMNPQRISLKDALRHVRELRAEEEESCEGFDMIAPDQFRLQIVKAKEINHYLSERFHV